MSDTVKPKRPQTKSGHAPRSRPPARDARAEATQSKGDQDHGLGRSHTKLAPVPHRVASLEAELARLREEHAAEADQLARMLVRIADAERARTAAESRAEELAERVRELETHADGARRGAEGADMAIRRAELAEKSAADGAAALERMRAELQADRSRLTDVEAKLARTRREHTDELATLRAARVEADRHAARTLEEEQSAGARARQQVAALELELAATRDRAAQAATLVEKIERREEMAGALRARGLEQARHLLTGEITSARLDAASAPPLASRPPKGPPMATKPRIPADAESTVELLALDELEIDSID